MPVLCVASRLLSSTLATKNPRWRCSAWWRKPLSGKMRLKGEVGKWREMERFEWKVGVETAFFCAAASFLFFFGGMSGTG